MNRFILTTFCTVLVCLMKTTIAEDSFVVPAQKVLTELKGPRLFCGEDVREFTARLDFDEDQAPVLRMGLECTSMHGDVRGNVWLDVAYSIPASLCAYDPREGKLEGTLIVPTQKNSWIESTSIGLRQGFSTGRLLPIRRGKEYRWDDAGITLPAGEHLLQLSWSGRALRDAEWGSDPAKRRLPFDPNEPLVAHKSPPKWDGILCRSAACAVRVPDADRPLPATRNNSPIQSVIRTVGPSPRNLGDSVTFEVLLQNKSEENVELWYESGELRLDIDNREFPRAISHRDLFQHIEKPFVRYGDFLRSDHLSSQIVLPPNCYMARKVVVEDWQIPGRFTIQAKYPTGLFRPVGKNQSAQKDAPASAPIVSNALTFTVAEK